MKIGIVGYQGSGKSSLFHGLTGVEPDPGHAHLGQAAMAAVPDERIAQLCDVYHPKKTTFASLELVDTPGLARDHQGNAARLAFIREAGCLVVVVAGYDRPDPVADLASFEEDLLLADLEIVSGRVERLRVSVKRPRPTQEAEQAELDALQPVLEQLEAGTALHAISLHKDQSRAISSFRLLTEKPRLVILNTPDDADDGEQLVREVQDKLGPAGASSNTTIRAIPVGLQSELARMSEADRDEMVREMDLTLVDRDALLRQIMDASSQMLFFTAGEKEVRTWMTRQGSTALEAAGAIHTDLARGFIRAETIACADLVRTGSEREAKAQHLYRQEPKDYVIQDGDVVNIKFSV
jgi:ribosome-binding ATPase YchF (GTP1/OBG family)